MYREKLSICIPTYNRSSYLKRAIESCLTSKSKEIKIYIQDNDSTDDTEKVINEFDDLRIDYMKNPENIGGALNAEKLIERSTGEYIFFLTDDDCLLPGAIEKILSFIRDSQVGFFTSDTIMYLEKSKNASLYNFFRATNIFGLEDYTNVAKTFCSSHIWTRCCFKKAIYNISFREKLGKNAYTLTGVCMMAIIQKEKMGYIAEPLTLHTWENVVFWELDVDKADNYVFLNNEIAKIILCAKEKLDQKLFEAIIKEYCMMRNYINQDISNNISSSLNCEIKKSIRKKIFKNKIKNLLKKAVTVFGLKE